MKTSRFLNVLRENDCYIVHNPLYPNVIKVQDPLLFEVIDKITEEKGSYDFKFENENQTRLYEDLIKTKIIVPDTTNELNIVNYAYSRVTKHRPLQVFLFPTRNCNFRCPYCYEVHEESIMPVEYYEKALNYIVQRVVNDRYKSVLVSWFGGEPTLKYDKIVSFMKDLHEKLPRDIEIDGQMTTNGFLLSEERFRSLVNLGVTKYQITIDGLAQTHNTTRVLAGGKPTWTTIMNNLTAAQKTELNYHVTIRTNVTNSMMDTVEDWMAYLAKTFGSDNRFSYHFETVKDLGGDDKSFSFTQDDPTKYLSKLVIKYGLGKNTLHKHMLPFNMICYAADPNSIVIDTDGSLMKCTVAIDETYNKIGHLNSGINIEKMAWWTYYDLKEECKNCTLLPLCYGRKCPNSFFSPKMCDLVKEYYFAALRTMI